MHMEGIPIRAAARRLSCPAKSKWQLRKELERLAGHAKDTRTHTNTLWCVRRESQIQAARAARRIFAFEGVGRKLPLKAN